MTIFFFIYLNSCLSKSISCPTVSYYIILCKVYCHGEAMLSMNLYICDNAEKRNYLHRTVETV